MTVDPIVLIFPRAGFSIPPERVSYSCAGVLLEKTPDTKVVLPKYETTCVVKMVSLGGQLKALLQRVSLYGTCPSVCQSFGTPRGPAQGGNCDRVNFFDPKRRLLKRG